MTAIILPFPTPTRFWSCDPDSDQTGATTTESVSLERCIDWLLDRHQSTTEPVLRRLVSEVLTELEELGPLCDDGELDELVIGALASIEAAFDIAC
ncbi:MAG: hypothetical protein AAFN30_01815 [Actinomycetota bacterium]